MKAVGIEEVFSFQSGAGFADELWLAPMHQSSTLVSKSNFKIQSLKLGLMMSNYYFLGEGTHLLYVEEIIGIFLFFWLVPLRHSRERLSLAQSVQYFPIFYSRPFFTQPL